MDKFIQGCMRIKIMSVAEVRALIESNLSAGINTFDHADIYGEGECEILFGKALKEDQIGRASCRERVLIKV